MNRSTSDVHRSAVIGPSPAAVITDMTLLSIAILFGFAGNTRVCHILKKRQDLRKVPRFLFASLAVTGIFSSLVALPSRLATATLNHHLDKPQHAEYTCNVWITSAFICGVINAVTLSFMAIDRHDCALRPFNRRMKPSNIRAVIAISWIGTLVLSSVLSFSILYGESVCHEFNPNAFFSKLLDKHPIFIYYITLGISFNVVCSLIIVTTAIRIIRRLRSSPLPDSQTLHRRQENKLTWLTYKICGVLIFCWLPYIGSTGFALTGGIRGNAAINAVVVSSTVSYYYYVLNPLLHYHLLWDRGTVNHFSGPANRRPIDGIQMNVVYHNQVAVNDNIPRAELSSLDINPTNNANVQVDVEVYDTHCRRPQNKHVKRQ